VNAAELEWLDGLIGVASGDSGRVARATLAIADTGIVGRRLRGSLPALWRERQTNNIDALVVQADSTMALGGTFGPVIFVHHIAIGRGLTKKRDAAGAERYLQWADVRSGNIRMASVAFAFAPYTSYERALAFEAANDRARAKLHFERFVDMVDMPPPAIKAKVHDAKARLARLGGDARR
jgi:hypothetical protein